MRERHNLPMDSNWRSRFQSNRSVSTPPRLQNRNVFFPIDELGSAVDNLRIDQPTPIYPAYSTPLTNAQFEQTSRRQSLQDQPLYNFRESSTYPCSMPLQLSITNIDSSMNLSEIKFCLKKHLHLKPSEPLPFDVHETDKGSWTTSVLLSVSSDQTKYYGPDLISKLHRKLFGSKRVIVSLNPSQNELIFNKIRAWAESKRYFASEQDFISKFSQACQNNEHYLNINYQRFQKDVVSDRVV